VETFYRLPDSTFRARLTAMLKRTATQRRCYHADGFPWRPRSLNQAIDRLLESLAKDGAAAVPWQRP